MDHLPHPQDAAFPPVRVPYYYDRKRQKYKYDGGSFTDYPDRCGFDKSAFMSADFSAVPSTDHNFFFQTWLFFGLIHEVLGANLDEFIDHQEQRVTTARLPYWLAKWQRRLTCSRRSKRIAERERVSECLREVSDMIARLDYRKFREEGRSYLNEEVGLSIIVLGLTLTTVPNYGGRRSPTSVRGMTDEDMAEVGWLTSEFARKRLEAAGWCKYELSRLETYMSSTGILYCGSMSHFGRTIDHSRCSERQGRCAADDIDEETYETAHAEGCNLKGCEHVGPNLSDLKSVLVKGSFPVIGLTKLERTSDICISVLPHCKSMAYTAITHVWADGLGNPLGNTLPKCQILRLYQLLQSNNRSSEGYTTRVLAWMRMLPPSKTNTVYLWIDTLCVPLEKEFRGKAIDLMYNSYNDAKTVLLLDRSLLSISAERPMEELCFRITASPWMRRTWTLQEGALAKTLSVQFADRTIDARKARESLRNRTEGTKLYNMAVLESCSAIAHVEDCGDNEHADQVATVLSCLIHRSTSHPKDKLICFAIMMGCDMKRISEVEGDLRTLRVYQHLKYIPRGFLWQDGPTLDIPGFRWAPKDIFSVPRGHLYDGMVLSERGLLVSTYGMVYFGRSHCMTTWAPHIKDVTSGKRCILLIKDVTSRRWFYLHWRAGESLNGALGRSEAPWTTLAVILQEDTAHPGSHKGAVIRLDWNPSMATYQELSDYIRGCDQISGAYMGNAQVDEFDQEDYNRFEQQNVALEDYPQQQSQIIEIGDDIFIMCEAKLLGLQQEWCIK